MGPVVHPRPSSLTAATRPGNKATSEPAATTRHEDAAAVGAVAVEAGAVGVEVVAGNPSGEISGTVKKTETSLRFYDSGNKFMGFMNPSGSWVPELGTNRRGMRITPEQAQFSLNIFKAITSIK